MKHDITVRRQGRRWGVYGERADGTHELIEGGFFDKSAAEASAENWRRECLQSQVEQAERAAGWDPNP